MAVVALPGRGPAAGPGPGVPVAGGGRARPAAGHQPGRRGLPGRSRPDRRGARCTPTRWRSAPAARWSRRGRPTWCRAPGCWPGPRTPSGWWPRSAPGWRPAPCRRSAGVPRDLVVAGLLDLRVLSRTYGVPVAGWSPAWRHVWPRDSALAAAALARTGHHADAERIVAFLRPGAAGVGRAGRALPRRRAGRARRPRRPAGRGGLGAVGDGRRWPQALPAADRAAFVRRHQPLLDRSTAAARAAIDNPRTLPPVSADYWEVRGAAADPVDRRTAGGRAGLGGRPLRGAGRRGGDDGDGRRGRAAAVGDPGPVRPARLPPAPGRASRQRRPGGELPAAAVLGRGRAGGGRRVAAGRPGDGPAGGRAGARRVVAAGRDQLDERDRDVRPDRRRPGRAGAGAGAGSAWLDRHRTPAGSFPEKVLADGRPASVAPLAWTAAAVVLTADALSG